MNDQKSAFQPSGVWVRPNHFCLSDKQLMLKTDHDARPQIGPVMGGPESGLTDIQHAGHGFWNCRMLDVQVNLAIAVNAWFPTEFDGDGLGHL